MHGRLRDMPLFACAAALLGFDAVQAAMYGGSVQPTGQGLAHRRPISHQGLKTLLRGVFGFHRIVQYAAACGIHHIAVARDNGCERFGIAVPMPTLQQLHLARFHVRSPWGIPIDSFYPYRRHPGRKPQPLAPRV